MFGDSYVTSAEFRTAATGFDVGAISDADLETILSRASRTAEIYARVIWAVKDAEGNWGPAQYNQWQEWRPSSRRVYLRHWPVTEIVSAKIWIGANVYAQLRVVDFLINNTQHYIVLASLASATTLTPELLTLGISEPVIDVTYKAGYTTIPEEVKLAVVLIAASTIAQKQLIEEGVAGVRSFVIGTYSVTVGRGDGEPAGFACPIPEAARQILEFYRMTPLK